MNVIIKNEKLTADEYAFLQKYDVNLNSAFKSNYCRSIPKDDLLKMKEIYDRVTHTDYRLNTSCSTCILKLIRKLAPFYFSYVADSVKPINDGNKENLKRRSKTKGASDNPITS